MPDRLAVPAAAAGRELLGQALADAVNYRDPPQECAACEAGGGLCANCAAGLERARAYLALGRDLGLDVPA